VLLVCRLRQRDYETRDGERRSTLELDIDELAVSLRYAAATPTEDQPVEHRPRQLATQPIQLGVVVLPEQPVEAG